MEVFDPQEVSISRIFKAIAPLTFGIVHIDDVEGVTVLHVDVVLVEVVVCNTV
jgi:hypothetical protein